MISLFVDNLTNLDFSYLDPQRGLVGETLIVDAKLTGELDEQGMVFDFGKIKRQLRKAIEDLVDHKLLIPEQSQPITREKDKHTVSGEWLVNTGESIFYRMPEIAVHALPASAYSLTFLTDYIQQKNIQGSSGQC